MGRAGCPRKKKFLVVKKKYERKKKLKCSESKKKNV